MTLSATKTESWNATAAYPATNEDGDDDYGDKNWRPSTKKRTQKVKIIYIYACTFRCYNNLSLPIINIFSIYLHIFEHDQFTI